MKLASVLIIAVVGTVAAENDFLRELQPTNGTQLPPPPPKNGTRPPPPPKKYEDDFKIPFKADLGCGACIRGSYTYCVPGAEGSNSTQWKAGLKPVCCSTASCKEALDKANYNCSSQYSDKMMAKALCPFNRGACGQNTAFNFDSVGQNTKINITLPQGETCTFQVEAECGLPAFKPNDTTGFDIEVVDYDEDDLSLVGEVKALDWLS
jgi:hypothetical protein